MTALATETTAPDKVLVFLSGSDGQPMGRPARSTRRVTLFA
jgi:hypothetical protein